MRILFLLLSAGAFLASCSNNKNETPRSTASDSGQTAATAPPSTLPTSVVFRNWELGDAKNSQLIVDAYKAWDSDSTGALSAFFGDTTRFDLPDGTRVTLSNNSIESALRKWRKSYKATSNIPFSLISLHNKDLDQQWVIAWTWNKWQEADGSKDSMLMCDNWRFNDGKIVYLNSLENIPSKALLKTLSKLPSK